MICRIGLYPFRTYPVPATRCIVGTDVYLFAGVHITGVPEETVRGPKTAGVYGSTGTTYLRVHQNIRKLMFMMLMLIMPKV